MTQRILLISDIHGNYPALAAIHAHCNGLGYDTIINCGDSVVYAPFANETLSWLHQHATISILGNTDKKVIKLLKRKTFKKPANAEKRIMYESTAATLTKKNSRLLKSFKKKSFYTVLQKETKDRDKDITIGIFHGSPAANHEFLFDTTKTSRFLQLAAISKTDIVVTGHSHTPYHRKIGGVHFVNPGSVGRMFDGDPRASCAVLEISATTISVQHYRVNYDIEAVVQALAKRRLPEIYGQMYLKGRKLN